MFYVNRKVNGKFGVVDTEDWVEEFYTRDEIFKFESLGARVIARNSLPQEIVNFVWYYYATSGDVSGSTMDLVDAYLKDDRILSSLRRELGSSTCDIVIELKKKYDNIKLYWTDLNLDDLYKSDLYKTVSMASGYDKNKREKGISKLIKVYHFTRDDIIHGLMLDLEGYH